MRIDTYKRCPGDRALGVPPPAFNNGISTGTVVRIDRSSECYPYVVQVDGHPEGPKGRFIFSRRELYKE